MKGAKDSPQLLRLVEDNGGQELIPGLGSDVGTQSRFHFPNRQSARAFVAKLGADLVDIRFEGIEENAGFFEGSVDQMILEHVRRRIQDRD